MLSKRWLDNNQLCICQGLELHRRSPVNLQAQTRTKPVRSPSSRRLRKWAGRCTGNAYSRLRFCALFTHRFDSHLFGPLKVSLCKKKITAAIFLIAPWMNNAQWKWTVLRSRTSLWGLECLISCEQLLFMDSLDQLSLLCCFQPLMWDLNVHEDISGKGTDLSFLCS